MAERDRRKTRLDLSKYIDKRVIIKLNGNRQVAGVLRGYDDFMNITLDDLTIIKDNKPASENLGSSVIRGQAILMMESLDRVEATNYAPKTR